MNYKLYGIWWTATQDTSDSSTGRDWALSNISNSVLAGNSGKALAFSVRCVKD
ncbi:MAG: hypothetical protein IPP72_14280 [Chitinophagaceae bacterium]|nr:hypothetical protein [Chitinophagaceae bacterium]